MYEIEYCYASGRLELALIQAAEFVKKLKDDSTVKMIASDYDEQIGWTVYVVYEKKCKS